MINFEYETMEKRAEKVYFSVLFYPFIDEIGL